MTELRVTYRTSLDGELRAFMTQQLVKYLLFMRGQVPWCVLSYNCGITFGLSVFVGSLYDDLLQLVENFQHQQQQEHVNQPNKRRLPLGGGIKKAVKCVEASEKLFQIQLDAVFALQVKRVALVFGSSMMSPREAVLVDFDDVNDSGATTFSASTDLHQSDPENASLEHLQTVTSPSSPMIREKLMRLCAQKLVRALFARSMEHFACALPATKLHIAVLAERQPTRIPGFLPKQQFNLRLPKRKRGIRTHYLTICSSDDSRKQEDSQHPAAQQTTSDDTNIVASDTEVYCSSVQRSVDTCNSGMVWYVMEKPIAGFSEAINTLGSQ